MISQRTFPLTLEILLIVVKNVGKSMAQTDQILTLSAGTSQLISAICDEIGFEEVQNEQLIWDKERCHCRLEPV
jgi:hypothetical protein